MYFKCLVSRLFQYLYELVAPYISFKILPKLSTRTALNTGSEICLHAFHASELLSHLIVVNMHKKMSRNNIRRLRKQNSAYRDVQRNGLNDPEQGWHIEFNSEIRTFYILFPLSKYCISQRNHSSNLEMKKKRCFNPLNCCYYEIEALL